MPYNLNNKADVMRMAGELMITLEVLSTKAMPKFQRDQVLARLAILKKWDAEFNVNRAMFDGSKVNGVVTTNGNVGQSQIAGNPE